MFENLSPEVIEAVERMCREAGIPPHEERRDGDR